MQVKMCSRCGKNVAVVFITKMEGESERYARNARKLNALNLRGKP